MNEANDRYHGSVGVCHSRGIFFSLARRARSLSVVERRKKEFLKIFDDDHNDTDDEKTDPRKNGYVAYRPSGRTHEERERKRNTRRGMKRRRAPLSLPPISFLARALRSRAL